jgi:histidinol phosphatase-like PHP family hydrolase
LDGDALDLNARISGFLRDLAFLQDVKQKAFAYNRAASAIMSLEQPIDTLLAEHGLDLKIPGLGPSSMRVVAETIVQGRAPSVEQAIDSRGRREEVERRRRDRHAFLSRAEVVRILADVSLESPTLKGYRGDVQMHSQWSDGVATIAEMADGCLARGYRYAAITDHSVGLPVAGGLTMEALTRQHREIDQINARYGDAFRVLKGIEANIAADGSLDLSADEIPQCEFVLAAPHSKLRIDGDQTARLVRAVTTTGVHVLAHPRGRKIDVRAGVRADWPTVFREAARAGVAIEIDGDPSRQDLDHELAAVARESGCVFALDSDAHSVGQLRYTETAIAHARLARIPEARIINYWPLRRLLAWARDRQAPRRRPAVKRPAKQTPPR